MPEAFWDVMISAWGARVTSVVVLAAIVIAGFAAWKILRSSASIKLGPLEISKAGDHTQKVAVLEAQLQALQRDYDAALQAVQCAWTKSVGERPGDFIGFAVPRGAIFVFGDMWGSDRISDEGYQKLEDQWSDQSCINLVNSNITSPIISIIDSKARKLPAITVVCSEDQQKLLNYFKPEEGKESNVTLEIR